MSADLISKICLISQFQAVLIFQVFLPLNTNNVFEKLVMYYRHEATMLLVTDWLKVFFKNSDIQWNLVITTMFVTKD